MPVPAVVAGAPFAATSKLIVGDTKLTPLTSLSLRHSNKLVGPAVLRVVGSYRDDDWGSTISTYGS